MATSRITDEAELGTFADFLGTKITVVFLSKQNFHAYDINIVNFSEQFVEANTKNEQAVTREDVEFYWWLAVRKLFKTGDPDQERLLRQASTSKFLWTRCSYFQDFVDRVFLDASEAEEKEKKKMEKRSGGHFWPKGLAFQTQAYCPGDIFTRTHYGEVLVPEINLNRIQDVDFLDLGIKVCRANPDKKISYSKFKALWLAIMEKVYDFESPYETSKKIEESLAVNHLDFELAVGKIDIPEYNQRMVENNERVAQSKAHFDGRINENSSTGSDEYASAEDGMAPESKASGRKRKKRCPDCRRNNKEPTEVSRVADEDDALLDAEDSTPSDYNPYSPCHGTENSVGSSPAAPDDWPNDVPDVVMDAGTELAILESP